MLHRMGINTVSKGKSEVRRKVGFYGCRGGLVRLELVAEVHPTKHRLDCPNCGHNHTVKIGWRPYVESLDEGKEAIQLEPETA